MCGIVGVYNYGGSRDVDAGALHRMCEVIQHRGPDSEGIFRPDTGPGRIGLGIRRLAIIDLETGNQPIHNEDRTVWIVLNGEIYNYRELKTELEKRHRFSTKSDTEVILHLYEEHGERCVDYLRGMFAFAIWDERAGRLFIAKDRVGKKPLYYTRENGSLVFGSEIKSILAYIGHTPELDPEALDLYLTYQYVPSPRTIYRGIHSLPPAHTLICDRQGNIVTNRYWDLDFSQKTSLSFADACDCTRELLTEATRLRMISDVPLGAFLSGGHDSSIIVGLMSSLSKTPVKTFAIGFEEEEFSELHYARLVARHFNTDHREFILKANFVDLLPKIIWHYGQPFADSSALPSYLVSQETRKHVTVALNGDGGDESFGGYLRYKAMKASLYFSLPFRLLGSSAMSRIAQWVPHTETTKGRNMFRYASRLLSALAEPPEIRNVYWFSFFTPAAKERLYTDHFKSLLPADAIDYLKNIFMQAPAKDIMDKTFYTDIKAYLPECLLVKMDIASMANSLEARSPFLDHKVMEFSASLPSQWKLHGLTTKYILKKTFDSLLPKEITRRGKMGFGIPVGRWFRGEWKEQFRDIVLSPAALSRGYFKKEALETMYNEHVSGRRDHGYRMWSLLVLEHWHRQYLNDFKL